MIGRAVPPKVGKESPVAHHSWDGSGWMEKDGRKRFLPPASSNYHRMIGKMKKRSE